jgi:hypothetical protein
MILEIDKMNSNVGWSGTAELLPENELSDFIANENTKSMMIKFTAIGQYIEKTFSTPIDVSEYEEFSMHTLGLYSKKQDYKKDTDFYYTIEIGTGNEFYLKSFDSLAIQNISLSGISEIDKIRITALKNVPDVLICSSAVAVIHSYPLDVLNALQGLISSIRDTKPVINIANIDITANTSNIVFSSLPDYICNYAVLKFSGGGHSEIHQIKKIIGNTVSFLDTYDGETILHSYTGCSVSLYFPVEYDKVQREKTIAGISLWGITPEISDEESDIYTETDSWRVDGTVQQRNTGHWSTYQIQIDAESRSYKLLNMLAEVVKISIARNKLWMNNRKHYIDFTSPAQELDNTDVVDILPKISYFCYVKFKFDTFDRETIYGTKTININAEVR